jgi:hypothetical protein
VEVDQFDLHAVALGPAAVHALEHAGPILALGPARARIDLDIAVVGVGLARQQGGDLVAFGPLGKVGQRADAVVDQAVVILGSAISISSTVSVSSVSSLRVAAIASSSRRRSRITSCAPGVVPQRRVLDLRVELLQPPQRPSQSRNRRRRAWRH